MDIKYLRKLALYCSLGVALCAYSGASVQAEEYLSVVNDGVNLRSGPGLNYEIIYQLPLTYPLKVVSKKGQWIKVEDCEGDMGWIFDTLVEPSRYVIVKAEECNVRSGPGTDNSKVGTVARDVLLKQVETQGDWIKVSHPQLEGWIHKNLVWP